MLEKVGDSKDINHLFLFNLYYYYYNKGYTNLILNEIINLFVMVYTVFLLIFLTQCLNFKDLIQYTAKERISIGAFINVSNFWNFNPFIIICIIIFVGYVFIRIISIYASIKKFWFIKKIYQEDLKISNNDLNTLSWNEVSNKIIKYYCNPNLNVYTLALKIMTKENLIISVYDELDDLNFHKYPLTKLLEWNFIFCFINPLINKNREINNENKINRDIYVQKVITNLKRVTIINLLFLPFLFIFMVLYMILQYGEQFYNNPKLIVNRQWSIKASWKIRYYNELPHLFYNRIEKAGQNIKDYDKQFPSKIYETIAHFFTFIIGSLFIILLILSLLNENLLINLNISNGKTILWYMSILGGVLTLTKSFINKNVIYDPEKYLKKVSEYIDIDPEWIKDSRNISIRKKLLKQFPKRAVLLLEECYCLLLTPYILWFVLKKESIVICDYLINSLENHHSVNGFVHKNSLFVNYTQIQNHIKTSKSFKNFQENYPEYQLINFLYNRDTYNNSNNFNGTYDSIIPTSNNNSNNNTSNNKSPFNSNMNTINETPENTIGALIDY
jgi:autophagy-related protein 9